MNSKNLETWIANFNGEPCGYFELLRDGKELRITLLGLTPDFIGKELGSCLIDAALEKAWNHAPQRIFLDTCSKDHPNALPSYLRHGFRIIRTEFADELRIR